ncbi:MAG TPA: M28 family peptidase [bacterium]|nr:M28 family peptidase [bacterium]
MRDDAGRTSTLLAAISEPTLTAHTREIARWTRLSGSADERDAAAYAEERLRAAGYRTRILVHDAYISLPGRAALRITHPAAREMFCITHSMARSTGPGGVAGDLVDVGKGRPEDYTRAGVAGKIALVDDLATPEQAVAASRLGAAGLIFVSGRHAHEMCISPVWGNPAPSTAGTLPTIPMVSVHHEGGRTLQDLCRAGRVAVHVTAEVRTGWTQTPIVLGDLPAGHPDADDGLFVLFSGHLDGWHFGAMDNGTANATTLEVARVLAERRATWRRGLRVAMWSGHSHGRYSSSAWYADNHWSELAAHCAAHVNIDSVGGSGADRFVTNSMPQTAALGTWAVREIAGAALAPKRVGRDSDQSFLGIGIPSLFGSLSHQEDGSLGWWWHTPHDTVDKIDPERLLRDAKIFALALDRLLTDPVLPLDYGAAAADLRAALDALVKDAGPSAGFGPLAEEASRLADLCGRLMRLAGGASGERAKRVNACLVALGRALIPATYTAAGRYAHDPALDNEFLPGLSPARRLASLPADSDEAKFLLVDLVRARNAVLDAVRTACRIAEDAIASAR